MHRKSQVKKAKAHHCHPCPGQHEYIQEKTVSSRGGMGWFSRGRTVTKADVSSVQAVRGKAVTVLTRPPGCDNYSQ